MLMNSAYNFHNVLVNICQAKFGQCRASSHNQLIVGKLRVPAWKGAFLIFLDGLGLPPMDGCRIWEYLHLFRNAPVRFRSSRFSRNQLFPGVRQIDTSSRCREHPLDSADDSWALWGTQKPFVFSLPGFSGVVPLTELWSVPCAASCGCCCFCYCVGLLSINICINHYSQYQPPINIDHDQLVVVVVAFGFFVAVVCCLSFFVSPSSTYATGKLHEIVQEWCTGWWF